MSKLVTIIAHGEGWLRPENIIARDSLTGYTVEFVADHPTSQRLKLYSFDYEKTDLEMLADFADLQPALYADTKGDFTFSATASIFAKLDIRRAMRALGNESTLDALLDLVPQFKTDWADAQEIDLADPMVQQALESASIDIAAVKVAIGNL